MILNAASLRRSVGLIVPVYFEPTVPETTVRSILEQTFDGQEFYCDPHNCLIVVDQGSTAESVLRGCSSLPPAAGGAILLLDRNRGKTGSIRDGLKRFLEVSQVPFIATRDCDGDNAIEDLPAMLELALEMSEILKNPSVAVFGARPSLARPMNWSRKEWELLTNGLSIALVDHLCARQSRVLDRRFWNTYPLDLQSGYRVFSRRAAEIALGALGSLPPDRESYLMGCEIAPFFDLSLQGGAVGQVMRSTLVEQPVSGYTSVDFGATYGALFCHLAERFEVSEELLLGMLDNQLTNSDALCSDLREPMLALRERIGGRQPLQYPARM